MAVTVTVRESSTDYLDFQLLSASTGIDLSTAIRVQLVIKDKDGTVVTHSTDDASPQLYITDAVNGKVQFRPHLGDLTYWRGPYQCHFWVVISALVKGSVPEDEEFTIKVQQKFD